MERDGDYCDLAEKSQPRDRINDQSSSLSSSLFLDHAGEVTLTFNPDGLSWKLVGSSDNVRIYALYLINKYFFDHQCLWAKTYNVLAYWASWKVNCFTLSRLFFILIIFYTRGYKFCNFISL